MESLKSKIKAMDYEILGLSEVIYLNAEAFAPGACLPDCQTCDPGCSPGCSGGGVNPVNLVR